MFKIYTTQNKHSTLYLVALLLAFKTVSAQNKGYPIPPNIAFKDTMYGFATDSFAHNIGDVPETFNHLYKYFKYTGKDSVYITRAWTGDPHYICEYPNEALLPGKIYRFKVCFWMVSRFGSMHKRMGFNLSDGSIISYTFKANIVKEKSIPEREIPLQLLNNGR